MSDQKILTASERCARSLLAAWNTGSVAGLETALRQAAIARDVELSSGEKERMELVEEIAGSIRMWLRGIRCSQPVDLNVHLELLRHLARCEGRPHRNDEGTGVSAAATEVPRLEMLVSDLH